MAAKRRPTSDLNHINWDTEETPEDAGTFKRASDDQIKTRVIKTARRRNPIHSVRTDEDKKDVFGTFTGFSKAPAPASNAFGFLSNLTKPEQPKTNGISEKNENVSSSSLATEFPILAPKTTTSPLQPIVTQKTVGSPNKTNQENGKSNDYYARLKGLNESVSKWIKQHVDENPFVNLQPIFKDYEKYLDELEISSRKEESGTGSLNAISTTEPQGSAANSLASFVFKQAPKPVTTQPTQGDKIPSWNFGVPSSTSDSGISETPKFSFGIPSTSKTSPASNKQDDKPSIVSPGAPKMLFDMSGASKSPSEPQKQHEKLNTSSSKIPTFSFGVPGQDKASPETKGPGFISETKFSFGVPNTSKSSESNQQNKKLSSSFSESPKFAFGNTGTIKTTPESNRQSEKPCATLFDYPQKFSFGNASSTSKSPGEKDKTPSTSPSQTPKFSFGNLSADQSTSELNKQDDKTKFSFGAANAATSSGIFKLGPGASNFSFGSTNSSGSPGFNFPKPSSTVPGFTFSNVTKPVSSDDAQNDEDEDEPPKVEFTPVVEDGHIYTTKCKVFVKKDKDFGDRGVGNLFLKPVPDSEKTQLVVRADTNLGNLLCNFILSESIPIQKMGKKDVMLVCLPTPETKPPPVPILLRVKSPEEADKLLEMLKKYKK